MERTVEECMVVGCEVVICRKFGIRWMDGIRSSKLKFWSLFNEWMQVLLCIKLYIIEGDCIV